MSVLIDTSAFAAIGDIRDQNHSAAERRWQDLIALGEELVVPSYTVVETTAVLQRRAGSAGVLRFADTILPVITVVWVDSSLHNAAISAFLAAGAGRHAPSLVDCVSMELARRGRVDKVFAYDDHFKGQGFALIGQ